MVLCLKKIQNCGYELWFCDIKINKKFSGHVDAYMVEMH